MSFDTKTGCPTEINDLSQRLDISLYIFILFFYWRYNPLWGFSLLSDFLPYCSFFTLLTPPSYSHYFQILFNACNPSLPWSPSSSRTYRFPL